MMHVKGTVAVHVTERVCDRCGGWGDERAAQDEPGLPGALVRCPKCNGSGYVPDGWEPDGLVEGVCVRCLQDAMIDKDGLCARCYEYGLLSEKAQPVAADWAAIAADAPF